MIRITLELITAFAAGLYAGMLALAIAGPVASVLVSGAVSAGVTTWFLRRLN